MSDTGLRPVCSAWLEKIQRAWQQKKKEFSDDADEAMAFFNGPYDWLYGGKYGRNTLGDDELPPPSFRMTANRVAEMVQLFGPALYSRNPVRRVKARRPPELPPELLAQVMGGGIDPQAAATLQQQLLAEDAARPLDEARAALIEHYLNYTPAALDLKTESRWAIDEAIIKGLGLLVTETYDPPAGGMRMVGSFYCSVDDLLLDPDATNIREAKWAARRCCHPYWEVERDYDLPPESLKKKAGLEGMNQQSAVAASAADYRRKQGLTNDLLVYWKVWSKMGLGGRLAGVATDLREGLDAFGDFCFLAVCDGCEYPLNVPPPLATDALSDDPMQRQAVQAEVTRRVAWPTPFWADDAWPFTPVAFHWVPGKIWPMSHVKPGLGELKFLNWAFSFLASKVRVASRDFIAIAKSAGEDLKDKIKHGGDYTVIEVEQIHDSIDKVVKFLQHPGFNPEIYTVIQGVSENFERRVGLNELLYGTSSRQMRSAQEAQIKGDYASIRPEDMALKVEDAMTEAARKEALACRWHLTGADVEPSMGPLGARWWDMLVVPSDPARVVHQLEYRVEAGSAKKPNKALERENMQQAVQTLFPTLWAYAQLTGDVSPVNSVIEAWARSIDLDAGKFLMAPPPPPAPVVPGPAGAGPPRTPAGNGQVPAGPGQVPATAPATATGGAPY